jgi:hypothetical protein
MVKVTPITVAYTILLLIATLSLTANTTLYYTNATVQNQLNITYKNLNLNFTNLIYGRTYNATVNSSSGLKASNFLNQFTGLAFMFGAMFQVATDVLTGLPMIQTVLSGLAQYSILPGVNLFALLGLFISGCTFLLLYWFISSWTKVEA